MPEDDTNEELRAQLLAATIATKLRDDMLLERERSDKLYAVKLVERIVYGLIGLILVGVVGALLALVLS